MEKYNFDLKVDLEGNAHTGTVLVEEVATGAVFQSKQLQGVNRDDLVQKAKDFKEKFLLIFGMKADEKAL